MELRRGIILILVMAAMTTVVILPCSSEEKNTDKDIWTEDDPRGPGGGPGRGGPGGGPGRGGRGPGRYRTREENIDIFLKELKESDPKKAKELTTLREKNPDKFREEIQKILRERWSKRMESWSRRRRTEFLEWLGKAFPQKAQYLDKLKATDTDLYAEKYEIIREKYWRIFEESRRNPPLAEVLMAEMELDERQEILIKEIKATKNEQQKKKLMAQLEEVVGDKYDLIIRKKIIAYEFLLKRIAELQKELNKSRDEIEKWKDPNIKEQNVMERTKELIEPSRPTQFKWR